MTPLDEFFTALTACKDRLMWQIEYPGQIRGIAKPGTPYQCFCPLTALVLSTHSQRLSLRDIGKAARLLGLSNLDARLIMAAADSPTSENEDMAAIRAHILSCFDLDSENEAVTAIRARMLSCLDLEEATP